MKNVDSKLLLGLVAGAAIGAAVGYLCGATDKREQLLEELGNLAGQVKDKTQCLAESIKGALVKTKCECEKTTEEIVAE